MSYERLNIQDGIDKWDVAKVQHLEDGIIANRQQVNWEENDISSPSYIVNRPFGAKYKLIAARGRGVQNPYKEGLPNPDITYLVIWNDKKYQGKTIDCDGNTDMSDTHLTLFLYDMDGNWVDVTELPAGPNGYGYSGGENWIRFSYLEADPGAGAPERWEVHFGMFDYFHEDIVLIYDPTQIDGIKTIDDKYIAKNIARLDQIDLNARVYEYTNLLYYYNDDSDYPTQKRVSVANVDCDEDIWNNLLNAYYPEEYRPGENFNRHPPQIALVLFDNLCAAIRGWDYSLEEIATCIKYLGKQNIFPKSDDPVIDTWVQGTFQLKVEGVAGLCTLTITRKGYIYGDNIRYSCSFSSTGDASYTDSYISFTIEDEIELDWLKVQETKIPTKMSQLVNDANLLEADTRQFFTLEQQQILRENIGLANPSWNVSDIYSPRYIQDRTHYEYGDLTQSYEVVANEPNQNYEITDIVQVPFYNDAPSAYGYYPCLGIYTDASDTPTEILELWSGHNENEWSYRDYYEDRTVRYNTNTNTIYLENVPERWIYDGKIKVCFTNEFKRKTLDEKFIPDTIARKSTLAMPDLIEAPTAEDFNNLLRLLRASGYLATE